jgi:hypothetical protein
MPTDIYIYSYLVKFVLVQFYHYYKLKYFHALFFVISEN